MVTDTLSDISDIHHAQFTVVGQGQPGLCMEQADHHSSPIHGGEGSLMQRAISKRATHLQLPLDWNSSAFQTGQVVRPCRLQGQRPAVWYSALLLVQWMC